LRRAPEQHRAGGIVAGIVVLHPGDTRKGGGSQRKRSESLRNKWMTWVVERE
jgi:hypothetical protein